MVLSKAAAARFLSISRTTLYKLIAAGAIATTARGRIDQAELRRYAAHIGQVNSLDSLNTLDRAGDAYDATQDQQRRGSEHIEQPEHSEHVAQLQAQLDAALARERALLVLLADIQQRYGAIARPVRPRRLNPDLHYLGALCERGHDYQGTGKSRRQRHNQTCMACNAMAARRLRRLRAV